MRVFTSFRVVLRQVGGGSGGTPQLFNTACVVGPDELPVGPRLVVVVVG